jgi:hypothetical protein
MKNVGTIYGHLEYIMAIWHMSWPFDNLHIGHLVHFPPFGYIVSRQIWQPCSSLEKVDSPK